MSHIFISYSHKDASDVAELFHTRLMGCGYQIWQDKHSLELGDSFPQKISDAIEDVEYFIIIITPAALESTWVRDEIDMALVARCKVIPVILGDAKPPLYLRKIQSLFMRDAGDWQALDKLVDNFKKGASIPRVYNMSGHKDIQVDGILVLGHSEFGLTDLNEPATLDATARRMAQDALPYIKAGAGIVPHGHPALACAILAFLLGAVNDMPKLYYTFKQRDQFGISIEKHIALQDIRNAGFLFRSQA